ncbi:MAG TPA: hypothetical protein VLL47_11300 [Robiginitalea sp.]|nr:hypothetical protein [Robiginitalea sp.]
MRKQTFIPVFFALLLCWSGLRGQQRISDARELAALQATPLEAVYLHLSSTTLFPGEYLYYSLYTINTRTYRLSDISKVAYVQLVGANGTVYHTRKILLTGGRGQGDFFFETNLPSGAYKLIAFTHWMKNAGVAQFFIADLTVLNPYLGEASALTAGTHPPVAPPGDAESSSAQAILASAGLALETDQAVYGPGEQVRLDLRNYKGTLGHGSYSLSVARVEEVPELPALTSEGFAATYPQKLRQIPQEVDDTFWAPEQRGALITGRVVGSPGGSPAAGRTVAISLPGENFQLLPAETNSEGRFFAYLNAPYTRETGFAELLDGPAGSYEFRMDDLATWEGSLGDFRNIRIDTSLADAITRRSVHNQIENSYYLVKPDTVTAPQPEESYFGHFPKTYDLDQYTRFPTFRETLLEVVENVFMRREADEKYTLRVRVPLQPGQEFFTDDPPLVIVDGILVPDHTTLLNLDANRIRTIRVIQENIFWGGIKYQGMVAVETLDGDFGDSWQSEAGTRFTFRRAEAPKKYYRQPLAGADPHIPDFRHQLLWEPDLRLEGAVLELPFVTSQVPGRYRICLEGFTTYGKPISLSGTFVVEGE